MNKKFKLINYKTKEETICDKVTIEGYDYYIGDVVTNIDELNVWDKTETKFHPYLKFIGTTKYAIEEFNKGNFLKVIATNNPYKDIPKITTEGCEIALKKINELFSWKDNLDSAEEIFECGFNNARELYPFSKQDMIDFSWFVSMYYMKKSNKVLPTKELLEIFLKQQPIILYYN